MKIQTTKKLLAFIIMMMFFSLTQHAFSQKKPQTTFWFCNCAERAGGCGNNKACRNYCIPHCSVKIIDRKNLVNDMAVNDPHHSGSQISFTPIILEADNPSKLFENKKILKLKNNSQKIAQQMEWGNVYAINSIRN